MVNPNRTAHTGDEHRAVDANEAAEQAPETIDIEALAKEFASADAATDKLDADAHGKLAEAEAELRAWLEAEQIAAREAFLLEGLDPLERSMLEQVLAKLDARAQALVDGRAPLAAAVRAEAQAATRARDCFSRWRRLTAVVTRRAPVAPPRLSVSR